MANDYLSNLSEEEIAKIESKLFKTYSKMAAIVDSSSDAIVSVDTNNAIVSWNRGAEEMYSYKTRDVLGKNLSILWPPGREDEAVKLSGQALSGQAVKDHETIHLNANKREIFVSLTLSPIRDEMDNVSGMSMIARDITERKLAEKKLSQYDEVERLNKLMIDREVRMVELKQKIKDLEAKLEGRVDPI